LTSLGAGERLTGERVTGESPTEPDPRPEGGSSQEEDLDRRHSPAADPRQAESSAGREGESNGEKGGREPSEDIASVDPLVAITLSRSQVDHVLRAVLGDHAPPSILGVMAGTGFHGPHVRALLGSRFRALQQNRRLAFAAGGPAGALVLSAGGC